MVMKLYATHEYIWKDLWETPIALRILVSITLWLVGTLFCILVNTFLPTGIVNWVLFFPLNMYCGFLLINEIGLCLIELIEEIKKTQVITKIKKFWREQDGS